MERVATGKRYAAFVSYSHSADNQLAPTLQDALQRLAKPWRQRRALEIFRDDTGLSVNPNLWTSITTALDGSDWFILLASPQAAQSEWVGKEIQHWVTHHGPNTILPVLTDGTWTWDPTHNNFAWDQPHLVTAVHPALHNVFTEEPRHLDMSWAKNDTQLTLRNPRFRDQIAQLAAPLHGITKDELESEDIHQQRRTQRITRLATTTLTILTITALIATLIAITSQREASAQEARAERQTERAEQQTLTATARRLAVQGLSDTALAPDLRLLLAAQGHGIEPSPQSSAALFSLLTTIGRDENGALQTASDEWEPVASPQNPVQPLEAVSGGPGPQISGRPAFAFGQDGSLIAPRPSGQEDDCCMAGAQSLGSMADPDAADIWSGDGWEHSRVSLPTGAIIRARSADGDLSLMSRPRPAGDRTEVTFGSGQTMRCTTAYPASGCPELTIERADGTVLATLPPNAGVGTDALSQGPSPNMFTDDGSKLLSLDPVAWVPLVTDVADGETLTIDLGESRFRVTTTGLVDDRTGWFVSRNRVQLFSLDDGAEVRTLTIDRTVVAAGFTRDGTTLVTSDGSGSIDVRSAEDGALLGTVTLPHDASYLRVDPTGTWVAVSGSGGTSIVDLASRRLIGTFSITTYGEPMTAEPGFSPDGRRLTTVQMGSPDLYPQVLTVLLDPDAWQRSACELAGRALSPEEWDRYVGRDDLEPACGDPGDRRSSAPATTVAPPTTTTAPTDQPSAATTSAPTSADPGADADADSAAALEAAIAAASRKWGETYGGRCPATSPDDLCSEIVSGSAAAGFVYIGYRYGSGMVATTSFAEQPDGTWVEREETGEVYEEGDESGGAGGYGPTPFQDSYEGE